MRYALFLAALALAACGSADDTDAAPRAETAVATPAPADAQAANTASDPAEPADIPIYGYSIVNTYPHDQGAFTQGLLWKDGHLYESTGRNGESTVRKVDLETGEVLQRHDVPFEYFGEGLVDWNGQLINLTWRAGKAFVLDQETFEVEGEFTYPGEGWGITSNGAQLIMSDGSDRLRFLDPETFEEVSSLRVTARGQPVGRLNELEWIEGEIWANVWQSNAIVRIDPATGGVTGVIDLTGLSQMAGIGPSRDFVLNGIAWDKDGGRLFVTGKYWPALFEIELAERPQPGQ
ncbi:glutaminyl-peptide cyclotransferase [Aquisalinus flavus]|nr:glutaminyl-peptide cyclotransferase [Aquisalinus flavus]UNE49270.1 glutaminyl-peptide cyclotransferase [Aquisalinus flavus]